MEIRSTGAGMGGEGSEGLGWTAGWVCEGFTTLLLQVLGVLPHPQLSLHPGFRLIEDVPIYLQVIDPAEVQLPITRGILCREAISALVWE